MNDESTQRYTSPFLSTSSDDVDTTALIILNSPIRRPPSRVFQKLWETSSIRVCADGGANRLYDAMISTRMMEEYIPTAIKGDLDSLRGRVRDYYESKGALVEKDPSQDTNDLDKSLQLVKHLLAKEGNNDRAATRILIYGAFGGRFDQEMGCMQALFKWGEAFNHNLALCNDDTCAILLSANKRHEIRLPNYGESSDNEFSLNNAGEGPTCGLIPLACSCDAVTTNGLKWDLHGVTTQFGGLVSTSNRAMKPVVQVTSSHPIVFTAEMISGEEEDASG